MGFKPFAKRQAVNILNTGEVLRLCSIEFQNDLELKNIRVAVYIKGNCKDDVVKLELHGNKRFDSVIADATIEIPYNNWIGFLSFEFKGVSINKDKKYWIKMRSDYLKSSEKYIGVLQDFPFPTTSQGISFPINASRVECYGIFKRD